MKRKAAMENELREKGSDETKEEEESDGEIGLSQEEQDDDALVENFEEKDVKEGKI